MSGGQEMYELRLYVVAGSRATRSAIAALSEALERQLDGRYSLQIIDVLEEPHLAAEARILATPTLDKVTPPPLARVVGDVSCGERVMAGLGLVRPGARRQTP